MSFESSKPLNSFGWRLLSEWRKANPNQNIVFSPLSIATAFWLAYGGATGNTKRELEAVFGFADEGVATLVRTKGADLARDFAAFLANRVYIDESLHVKSSYVRKIGEECLAKVNFKGDSDQNAQNINQWVNETTKGRIPTIIGPESIAPDTIMMIINALYFRGCWLMEFPEKDTHTGTFYGVNGPEQVPFMERRVLPMRYKSFKEFDGGMLELPYQSCAYSMFIFIPNQRDGWIRAEKELRESGTGLFDRDQYAYRGISRLLMPRWENTTTLTNMIDLLNRLGLSTPYGQSAEFDGITGTHVHLDEVVHESRIKVNEKGTEAAAYMRIRGGADPTQMVPLNLNIDHPFLYFIVDLKDGTVVFQGTQTSISEN